MMVEKVIEQIGFATPANTSNNLNESIVLSFYQFVQIETSANLHLAASLQKTVIDNVIDKLDKAVKEHPEIKQIAIGGGVSANSGVRDAVAEFCEKRGIKAFIPKRAFTTDNAAMVAIAGYFKYLDKDFCPLDIAPFARVEV